MLGGGEKMMVQTPQRGFQKILCPKKIQYGKKGFSKGKTPLLMSQSTSGKHPFPHLLIFEGKIKPFLNTLNLWGKIPNPFF